MGIYADIGLIGVDAVWRRAQAGPGALTEVQQLGNLDRLRVAVDDTDAGTSSPFTKLMM